MTKLNENIKFRYGVLIVLVKLKPFTSWLNAILKQMKPVQTLKNSTNRTNIHTFSLSDDQI